MQSFFTVDWLTLSTNAEIVVMLTSSSNAENALEIVEVLIINVMVFFC